MNMAGSKDIPNSWPIEKNDLPNNADLLYDADQVNRAFDKLADDINCALKGQAPLVVCVLIGGIVVAGRLISRLKIPCDIGYVHVSRYRDRTRGGDLDWLTNVYGQVENRVVLIIDDILDEGTTLLEIEKRLKAQGASRTLKAVLVKKRKSSVVTSVDFFGLEVPDRYVFGCGMDYRGRFRNLPEVYALAES
jgi:hypoxanthine phosphoribosyltransferase